MLLSSVAEADPKGFPGRPKYPDVKIYTKEDLFRDKDKVVIIDVRSSLEFDTLRVKGAQNISVAKKDPFIEKVKALETDRVLLQWSQLYEILHCLATCP